MCGAAGMQLHTNAASPQYLASKIEMLMTRRFSVLVLLFAALPCTLDAQSATPSGPIVTAEGPHLTLMAMASEAQVAPGSRLSLFFDVTPRRGIHVYAPGKHTYQVVKVTIDPRPWIRGQPAKYPKSEIYHFEPLDERVPVYQKPFQLVHEVTILATPAAKKALGGQSTVTIGAQLEYQACDDTVCYRPQTVPVSWTLSLKPLP